MVADGTQVLLSTLSNIVLNMVLESAVVVAVLITVAKRIKMDQ